MFSYESSPYVTVSKSLIRSANAAVAQDRSTPKRPRFTRRIPTFFWKFVRGFRTEKRKKLSLLKRLEQMHEQMNKDYVRNLQELAACTTTVTQMAAQVAEAEANLAEIQREAPTSVGPA